MGLTIGNVKLGVKQGSAIIEMNKIISAVYGYSGSFTGKPEVSKLI